MSSPNRAGRGFGMAFHHIKPGSFTFATEPKHSRLSRRFGNHGTESPGTCQAGHGDDHMNEQEDEVAHPGHGNNTSQAHLLRSVWQFAMGA